MSIELRVEKTVKDDGRRGYVVKDFTLLPRGKKLPQMYLDMYPICFAGYDGEMMINPKPGQWIKVKKGDFLSVEELEDIIAYLQECGNNLREANKKLAQIRKEWQGEIEFII